jgi:hypothetical protein
VRIGYAFPEPIAPALTLATVMALSRRGMAQQR